MAKSQSGGAIYPGRSQLQVCLLTDMNHLVVDTSAVSWKRACCQGQPSLPMETCCEFEVLQKRK